MASHVDLRSVRRLVSILRAHRIQVVHAHKGKAATLAILAGLVAPLPVLLLNRGVSFPLGWGQALMYAARRVAGVVAVCDSIRRELVAAGVPARKIEVIYSGTDTDRFHPAVDGRAVRRELGIGPDRFLATQVGVRSTKGNDDVIDAMVRVVEQIPQARLVIVGARDTRLLHERARERGVGHAVSVLGHREDIPEILRASNVCVDASWTGLGLTGALREALAVGTPVVATDLEGNPELVRHAEHGLLVPPRDVRGLADAVLTLARDPDRARAMGCAGRYRVVAAFSMRSKVERTEALYYRLVAAAHRA
jgi:glycosyltransferase involved in cell wall biosynthesis